MDTIIVTHYNRVVRNVTITLEEEVARWAKVWAAEHDTSVSRFLGELLKARMLRDQEYQAAMTRYLARRPGALRGNRAERYPARETLHER